MAFSSLPIIDLHSDLLSYLTFAPGRSVEDPISRSSYSQLRQGNVYIQTLAIFCTTKKGSTREAKEQIAAFLNLPPSTTCFIPSFENASGFAEEEESLTEVFQRLDQYLRELKYLLYISLTWERENRFGGGNRTRVGLKGDGVELLKWMSGKQIAVDLSHTSDELACDILNTIDKYSLQLPLLASHSNVRAIADYPRNLPEELVKEVISRQGLIGLNFFSAFIHPSDPYVLLRHVDYVLKHGGEKALCFGADFFCDKDAPGLAKKYQREEAYYPQLSDSSCYPFVLELFKQTVNGKQLSNIAFQNAYQFLKTMAPFGHKAIEKIDAWHKAEQTQQLSPAP